MLIKKQMYWKVLVILCVLFINQVAAAVPSTFNWFQLTPATSPSPRLNAMMAFDPVSNQLILFGGGIGSTTFNDTWAWNGTNWVQLFPLTSPPARVAGVMTLDPLTHQLILFGGNSGNTFFNDTWTWNGTNWIQLFPLTSPPARRLASMSFDPLTGQLLLFGGVGPLFNFLNDTWTWNGTNWIELFPLTSPSPREGSFMDFDQVTGQLILFGGDNALEIFQDTWNWNGSNWVQLFPITSPPPLTQGSMTFDLATGQLLLFGGITGFGNQFLNETWIWVGNNWVQLATQNSPPGRLGSVMSFDFFTGQLILFGGSTIRALNDTWTWLPLPEVTSVFPSSGPLSGGTSVTIQGSNFISVSSVRFGSQEAIDFVVDSPTQITAISPPGLPGTVDITVTTIVGTSLISSADQFTYTEAPIVTSVSPSFGPTSGGTAVTITGENFISVLAVTFGSQEALSFTVDSPTQITAISPPGSPGTVDVTVTTLFGTSLTSMADQFTYINVPIGAPIVTSIFPSFGPTSGGTPVTITGENFISVSAVSFGLQEALTFIVNSPTQIIAISPPGFAGTVNVTVTTPSGTSVPSVTDLFTYISVPIGSPTVISVSPAFGTTSGGTVVNIIGSNFNSVFSVKFGSVESPSFTVDSPTHITAISPPGSPGTVDVTVTTPFGTSLISPLDQFTYVNFPIITTISPTSGPTSGGTVVTITGENFISVLAVRFGSQEALSFTVDSPTQITAISPPGSPGTVDVTVTTPFGTSLPSIADQFTYVIPVFPPINLHGFQKANRFATQTDFVNILTWEANRQGNTAVAYKIYRGTNLKKLIAVIPAHQHHHLKFKDHNRKEDRTYTYSVVAVDEFGNMSTPATVTIKGHSSSSKGS